MRANHITRGTIPDGADSALIRSLPLHVSSFGFPSAVERHVRDVMEASGLGRGEYSMSHTSFGSSGYADSQGVERWAQMTLHVRNAPTYDIISCQTLWPRVIVRRFKTLSVAGRNPVSRTANLPNVTVSARLIASDARWDGSFPHPWPRGWQ